MICVPYMLAKCGSRRKELVEKLVKMCRTKSTLTLPSFLALLATVERS